MQKKPVPVLPLNLLQEILQNAANMLEEVFQCTVCFEDFPRRLGVSCRSNNKLEIQPSEAVESQKPCSSKSQHIDNAEVEELHQFCEECVRGQAIAATTDMLLVDGGVGLKCLAHKCGNSILFSECRSFIPVDVQTILNDRAVEIVLGSANIENLERCKRCAFAKEMDVPKEEVKVFSCLSCQYEYCRICEREWTDDHFGKKCQEVAQREEQDKKDRKRCGKQFSYDKYKQETPDAGDDSPQNYEPGSANMLDFSDHSGDSDDSDYFGG